jgi:hypothetical protein
MNKTKQIVDCIIDDIIGRRGFGDEYCSYPLEIQKEIKQDWSKKIKAILEK